MPAIHRVGNCTCSQKWVDDTNSREYSLFIAAPGIILTKGTNIEFSVALSFTETERLIIESEDGRKINRITRYNGSMCIDPDVTELSDEIVDLMKPFLGVTINDGIVATFPYDMYFTEIDQNRKVSK